MKLSDKWRMVDEILEERKDPILDGGKNRYNDALDRLEDTDNPYPWVIYTMIIVVCTIIYFLN